MRIVKFQLELCDLLEKVRNSYIVYQYKYPCTISL